jgi:O-antigen ligase
MDKIYKHKRLISIIIVAAIVYARCDLGIALGKHYVLANVLANALGLAWCVALFIQDKSATKKALLNPAMAWVVAFSILLFIYGHFKLGVYTDMYSRQYHILTVVPAILIMMILFHHKDDMLDVI